MNKPISFTTTVVSNEYTAKQTRKTRFKVDQSNLDSQDISSFSFETGQFVNLKVEPKVMRAYSIASSASHLPEFELCVKIVENGKGSTYIENMKKGDRVEFMGPFGHFGKSSDSKKIVMIATGTGIAPMRAICEEEAEKGFPVLTQLIFGVSEEEYASYQEYFQELDALHKNFIFHLYVSRPNASYQTDSVRKIGRVTSWVDEKTSLDFEDTQILICGNPAMVKQVQTLLRDEKGVDKETRKNDIVVEAY